MPEVQPASQNNGQLTQRFIEFVMMQAQQAALCLGQLPHPSTGETVVNLEAAKMFIDYLELLREKTRGNLSKEEENILNGILSELQLAFVQVSQNPQLASEPVKKEEASSEAHESLPQKEKSVSSEIELPDESEEHKKRFSKSYGS
ncbi:MAG: hypothetical protein A3F67_05455 [Verrucomicrobia bacterium RIFCSPHIGHO2_12_FULL_41_10]|nr:MAG: hypothetical protein A3F67_05455 [Verrucomicrobia bacterium RIFCSPHIGHO2_12_FULL_41_10]HLB32599.1 DUF1844 domain-containing protein [Chthoniobacterales bacterium]